MEEKKLEAIPIENFRIHIYRNSIEEFIKKNWDKRTFKLKWDEDDEFFRDLDQQAMCKALACTVYQHKDADGIAFFNRLWAIKLINMGAPKEKKYAADVNVEALEQFVTNMRKKYLW